MRSALALLLAAWAQLAPLLSCGASGGGPTDASGRSTEAASDVDINYLCKNWSAPWPACTSAASRYPTNRLLRSFPIGAWWDPTPDEYPVRSSRRWVLPLAPAAPLTCRTAAGLQGGRLQLAARRAALRRRRPARPDDARRRLGQVRPPRRARR